MTTRHFEGDDIPRIYVTITVRKSLGLLPPMAQKAYLLLKNAVFILGFALAIVTIINPDLVFLGDFRIPLVMILSWLFYDQVIARNRYGRSHILVTSRGVLLTEMNTYVLWEDIESYKHAGNLLSFTPAQGAGPPGLFSPRELVIPLSRDTRQIVMDLFRENVDRWSPGK